MIFFNKGSLLVALKRRYPEFTYLALVRSTSAISSVEAVGVSVVQGSFSDLEKITELSEKADVVINAADSDTVELSVSILKGMKARCVKGNGAGTLIHTSGTCNFFGEEAHTGDSEPKVWTVSEFRCVCSAKSNIVACTIRTPNLTLGW